MSAKMGQRAGCPSEFRQLVGIGGIGSGIFFALEGDRTLGRDESRPGRLLDVRDYCKLHIISHYVATLAAACPQLEFRVIPVGKVGNDAPGRQAILEMQQAGMDTRHVEVVSSAPTLFSVCFQYPDGSGGNITTSNSAAALLTPEDVEKLQLLLDQPSIALAAPEVPLKTRARFLELARRHGAFRAASFTAAEIASARELEMFANLDLVSLNASEAAVLAGQTLQPATPEPFLRACETAMSTSYPTLQIVVTAGAFGAFGYSQGVWDYCPAPQVRVSSTAGAGDALLGGILLAKNAGLPLLRNQPSISLGGERPFASALDFGVLLASCTVTSPHTIHPHAEMKSLLAFARENAVQLAPPVVQLMETGGMLPSLGPP